VVRNSRETTKSLRDTQIMLEPNRLVGLEEEA